MSTQKQKSPRVARASKRSATGKPQADVSDPARVAYMLSWRDRLIENLREQVRGHEELELLLEALLAFALFRVSAPDPKEQSFVGQIPKEELRAVLGQWRCEVSEDNDNYRVTFVGRACEQNAALGKEG